MSILPKLLKPPETVRGMLTLNENAFKKVIQLPTLHLKETNLSKILPIIKRFFLKLENYRCISKVSDKEHLISLNPDLFTGWDALTDDERDSLKSLSIDQNSFKRQDFTLKYNHFSADEIFKATLPVDQEGMSSYTRIGHIVHVNLREHLVPYKSLIGKVLLDKIKGCRTVVNKTDMIDNTYRNFKMELLCGENDLIASVKENKCSFQFDFSTVYWNSRLSTEHERVVKMLSPGDVLFDVFCGVGPFSIPAAKKKCIVFANDLNPDSYKWLDHNKKINKINDNYLSIFNKDGKDFIFDEIRNNLRKYLENETHKIIITMNLPAMAVDFLPHFIGLLEGYKFSKSQSNYPIVLLYCFTKGEDYVAIAKDLVIEKMGFDISSKIIDFARVRTVSSMKEMVRVTIRLDEDILSVNPRKVKRKNSIEEGSCKKFNNGKTEETEQCFQSGRS